MADYDAAMENKSPNAAYNPDEDVDRNGNGRGEDRDDDRREDDGEQQERARGGDDRGDRSRSRSPPRRRPPPAPPGKTEAPPSQVLGCFGLSIRTRDVDLEDEFSRYGEVEKAVVVYDQRSERSRGFGFVTMRTQEEAERCIEKLNGIELHGRNIRVAFSTTTKPHQSTPGQYMGFKDERGPDRGGYGGGRDRYDDRRRDDRGGYGGGRDRYDDRRRDDRYDDRRRDDRGGYRDDRRDDRYSDRRPERRDDYRDAPRDAPRRREESPGRRRSPVYDR